jgi:hypothetical protein
LSFIIVIVVVCVFVIIIIVIVVVVVFVFAVPPVMAVMAVMALCVCLSSFYLTTIKVSVSHFSKLTTLQSHCHPLLLTASMYCHAVHSYLILFSLLC